MGNGKTTTGGQERSTAIKRGPLGVWGSAGCWGEGAGYERRRPLVFTRGCGVGRGDRQNRANWWVRCEDEWFPQQCLGVQGQR